VSSNWGAPLAPLSGGKSNAFASYDPERNSFASEQSYDPERSSFAPEKHSSGSALPGNQFKENSFASKQSYDPERNSRATLAWEHSYDPERSAFGIPTLITAQKSYDPEVLQFTCFTSKKKVQILTLSRRCSRAP
jgi:hypothetical protein